MHFYDSSFPPQFRNFDLGLGAVVAVPRLWPALQHGAVPPRDRSWPRASRSLRGAGSSIVYDRRMYHNMASNPRT